MLTTAAVVFTAVMTGAAAAQTPITGAFGLEFDQEVPLAQLSASLGAPPYPRPPDNLAQSLPERPADSLPGWFLFRPVARPDLLAHPGVRFMVLRDQNRHPVRILAEHPQPDCIDDMLWLTRSLARKYQAEADPFGAARPGFRQSARFVSGHTQVDVSCGPRLLIEYTDADRYRAWLRHQDELLAARERTEAELADVRGRLERARLRRFADTFTAGDRFRVLGAFGVDFGRPADPAWFHTPNLVSDEPLPATPPVAPGELAGATFAITVGPEGVPVRIAAELPDPDGSAFQRLAGALREKYGPPLKDGPQHKIHKVNGDYLIARYVPADATARVVFIDDEARDAQQEREAAAQARRLAEQRRRFEEETAGL